jgi:hypothetical protein
MAAVLAVWSWSLRCTVVTKPLSNKRVLAYAGGALAYMFTLAMWIVFGPTSASPDVVLVSSGSLCIPGAFNWKGLLLYLGLGAVVPVTWIQVSFLHIVREINRCKKVLENASLGRSARNKKGDHGAVRRTSVTALSSARRTSVTDLRVVRRASVTDLGTVRRTTSVTALGAMRRTSAFDLSHVKAKSASQADAWTVASFIGAILLCIVPFLVTTTYSWATGDWAPGEVDLVAGVMLHIAPMMVVLASLFIGRSRSVRV